MMDQQKVCTDCGVSLPENGVEGLCPACLLKQGLGGEDSVGQTVPSSAPFDADEAGIVVEAVEEAAGRYTHMGEKGKGAMGRVLIVHDERLDRDIAMKELLPGLVNLEDGKVTPVRGATELVGRFLREARITGRLEHPCITPVYELGTRQDGRPYYTMKLVKGRTLAHAIQEAGPLEERLRLLPHFVDLCNAIAYAHSRGVIHRDIKPSNVVVGEFGETAVVDWGLAKAKHHSDARGDEMTSTILSMRSGKEEDARHTAYGQALGTPAYMPPEQAQGLLDKVDERSDIYALGAVLYELLTGHTPFTGRNVREVLEKVISEAPRPPRAFDSKIPVELAKMCEKALTKDPSKRYSSSKEFASLIERYRPPRPVGRFRHAIGLATLCTLVAVPVLVVVLNVTSANSLRLARERVEALGDPETKADTPMQQSATPQSFGPSPLGLLHSILIQFPELTERATKPNSGPSPFSIVRRRLDDWNQNEIDEMRSEIIPFKSAIEELKRIAAMPRRDENEFMCNKQFGQGMNYHFGRNLSFGAALGGEALIAMNDKQWDLALDACIALVRIEMHEMLQPLDLHNVSFTPIGTLPGQAFWLLSMLPDDAPCPEAQMDMLYRLVREVNQTDLRARKANARVNLYGRALEKAEYDAAQKSLLYHLSCLPALSFWRNMDRTCFLNHYCNAIELLKRPPNEAPRSAVPGMPMDVVGDPLAGVPLAFLRYPVTNNNSSLLSPNSLSGILKAEAWYRLAEYALLLRKYHHEHNDYPNTLDELVPAYLPEPLLDPYTAKPLLYRPLGDTYALYSAALDQKDSGGDAMLDWVWRNGR